MRREQEIEGCPRERGFIITRGESVPSRIFAFLEKSDKKYNTPLPGPVALVYTQIGCLIKTVLRRKLKMKNFVTMKN